MRDPPQDTSSLKISARLKAISAKLDDRDQTYVLKWRGFKGLKLLDPIDNISYGLTSTRILI